MRKAHSINHVHFSKILKNIYIYDYKLFCTIYLLCRMFLTYFTSTRFIMRKHDTSKHDDSQSKYGRIIIIDSITTTSPIVILEYYSPDRDAKLPCDSLEVVILPRRKTRNLVLTTVQQDISKIDLTEPLHRSCRPTKVVAVKGIYRTRL